MCTCSMTVSLQLVTLCNVFIHESGGMGDAANKSEAHVVARKA